MEGLGRIFNVVGAASGVHIPLTNARAVTFVTYEDDGSTIFTLQESINGNSAQNLAALARAHKGPGIGGTWTLVSQAAAATLNLGGDTTNDTMVLTVLGSSLSAGFNCVKGSVDGGNLVAIIHDLVHPRKATNLRRSVV